MNRAYVAADDRRPGPARGRAGRRHRRHRDQREVDVLRRRRPADDEPAPPGRRARPVRAARHDQAGPAPPGDARADRWSPRSTAPRSAAAWRSPWPATTGSRWTRPAPGSASPRSPWACCPGAGGVTRTVRMLGLAPALTTCAAHRPPDAPGRRPATPGWSTRSPPRPTEMLATAREPGSRRTRDAGSAVGPRRLSDARRHPGRRSGRQLPAFPATLRKQLKGNRLPAPEAILATAVEGARSTWTPP